MEGEGGGRAREGDCRATESSDGVRSEKATATRPSWNSKGLGRSRSHLLGSDDLPGRNLCKADLTGCQFHVDGEAAMCAGPESRVSADPANRRGERAAADPVSAVNAAPMTHRTSAVSHVGCRTRTNPSRLCTDTITKTVYGRKALAFTGAARHKSRLPHRQRESSPFLSICACR